MKKIFHTAIVIIGFMLVLQLSSCRDDDFDTSPSLKLSFSTDSLLFDTVFTTVGSSTRIFKIYNPHNARINISSIETASPNSYFVFNVDGRSGRRLQNIEIGAQDSLFVFVEVNVDPVQQDLPLIISDSIIFHVNNNVQNVKLIAWGQDAHFIRPNVVEPSGFSYHLITENAVWSGPKPWVIYGLVLIAPEVELTIAEGTNVHLHNRSAMIFLERSTFKVQGTIEQPVTFQGDRLEPGYKDLPGQWGYIWLTATSRDHEIDYAVIKNGTYGIVLDSIGSFTEPTLRIRNSIIKNMDQTGLEFRGSHVQAENLLVANCGAHAISMWIGGKYDFRHITVANYNIYQQKLRQTPSLIFNNYYVDTTGVFHIRDFERIYFGNSIIMGSLQEEIGMDYHPATQPDFLFDHCLVKTQRQTNFRSSFENSLFNQSPLFINAIAQDFRLAEDSPAVGAGNQQISATIPHDILGNSRTQRSDMGVYQYYEEEEEEE
jgi:hypothetical protein